MAARRPSAGRDGKAVYQAGQANSAPGFWPCRSNLYGSLQIQVMSKLEFPDSFANHCRIGHKQTPILESRWHSIAPVVCALSAGSTNPNRPLTGIQPAARAASCCESRMAPLRSRTQFRVRRSKTMTEGMQENYLNAEEGSPLTGLRLRRTVLRSNGRVRTEQPSLVMLKTESSSGGCRSDELAPSRHINMYMTDGGRGETIPFRG